MSCRREDDHFCVEVDQGSPLLATRSSTRRYVLKAGQNLGAPERTGGALKAGDTMAVPVRGAVFLNIPHALSEETLDFLLSLENPEFSRVLPEPGDILGWCKLQEQAERYAMPQSDLLIERFGPAIAGFSLGGIPVLDIRPRNWAQENKIAIYLHGGGFTLYSAASTLGHAVVLAD